MKGERCLSFVSQLADRSHRLAAYAVRRECSHLRPTAIYCSCEYVQCTHPSWTQCASLDIRDSGRQNLLRKPAVSASDTEIMDRKKCLTRAIPPRALRRHSSCHLARTSDGGLCITASCKYGFPAKRERDLSERWRVWVFHLYTIRSTSQGS